MKTTVKFLSNFWNDESGASAAEYALILVVIGLGIVTAGFFLQGAIGGALNTAGNCITAPSNTTC